MSAVTDKEMIHRCGKDRMPTYSIVSTVKNDGDKSTQTIVASYEIVAGDKDAAKILCDAEISAKDVSINA